MQTFYSHLLKIQYTKENQVTQVIKSHLLIISGTQSVFIFTFVAYSYSYATNI